jgi:hypothetical protein
VSRPDASAVEALAHQNLCDSVGWLHTLAPGSRYLNERGVVAMATPLDWPSGRIAVRASEELSPTEWADAAGGFLFADGKTGCVYARVGADDALTDVLTVRGFAQYSSLPKMVIETAPGPRAFDAGFVVRAAATDADVLGYAPVAGEAFAHLGMPADEVTRVVGHPRELLADDVIVGVAERADDGKIVAGAVVVLFEPGPVGWVGWVSCADDARGHALGDAVTRFVTNEAFARGAGLVTLEASPYGRNTYARMGYRSLYDYRLLIKV